MECFCSEFCCKFEYFWNFVNITFCDGGVYLETDACFFDLINPTQCSIKCAGFATEIIMGFCICSIETDTDPLDPDLFHLFCDLGRDKGPVCCHYDTKSFVSSILCDFEHVFADKRFPSAYDQDRISHLHNFVYEMLCFFCCKLSGWDLKG